MSVCPNCGAQSYGGKFCEICGTPLSVEQPAQPVQPAQEPPVQQAQAIPVQPVYAQPVQPVYQQPVQPGYQPSDTLQPVKIYQPPYTYVPEQKKTTNGLCVAGFILGLAGFFTLGLTGLIGLIISTIGVIIAFAKKQKGKVLGIIGLVLSLLMVVGWILFIANADKISEALDANDDGNSFEEWLFDDSYDGKIEIISETEWVEKNNGSCIIFEADDNFKFYRDYRDLTDNYYSGTYEIYFGYEGMDVLELRYGHYGYTADDICDKIENERGLDGVSEFMILVFHNDGDWIDGVNTCNVRWDTVYMGYYDDVHNRMDLTYLEDGKEYTFVSSYDFDPSSVVMPTTQATEPEEEFWGNDTVGTIELPQGEWDDCDESDGMDYYYLENIQKRNADTETRIQLSVISGQYDPSLAEEMADEFKAAMEENGYAVSIVEETTLGGYTAYTVSTQYESGKFYSVWFFVDNDLRMHYVTVEYFDTDTDSYVMVKDTYTFEPQ